MPSEEDEFLDQSLEARFLSLLTEVFPSISSFFGMSGGRGDEDGVNSGPESSDSRSLKKIDFKEKDRLNSGSNYDVWAIRMCWFLKEAGLWEHVSGGKKHPEPIIQGSTEVTPDMKK